MNGPRSLDNDEQTEESIAGKPTSSSQDDEEKISSHPTQKPQPRRASLIPNVHIIHKEAEQKVVDCDALCAQGCHVCLVYSCVACDSNDCCPESDNCDCYMPGGVGICIWVVCTFIYHLYSVTLRDDNMFDQIIFGYELVLCDVPIFIIVWLNKPKLLSFAIIVQIMATIGHAIICILLMTEVIGNGWGGFEEGLYGLTTDVPFELILALILIPFYEEKIPLWARTGIMSQYIQLDTKELDLQVEQGS